MSLTSTLALAFSFRKEAKIQFYVFHSILVAYAILVPTLYGNRETRLHGFRQL